MKNDPFLAHEAVDRAALLADVWERHICQHPAVSGNSHTAQAAARIGLLMGELYQHLGQLAAGARHP